MTDEHWVLVQNTDIVIHNGAEAHWGKTCETLKPTNIWGIFEALKLCESTKASSFVFVSSKSVPDTEYYVKELERAIAAFLEGISESDDLEGSHHDLGTGYGQSKWVAKYLVGESGKRSLRGCIVRPGYVLGESQSGGKFCYMFRRGEVLAASPVPNPH